MFFFTVSAWNIVILVFPISLLILTTSVVLVAAEEMINSYNPRPGQNRDLLAPPPPSSTSIFLPDDDGSGSNSLIAANSWTTTMDESSSSSSNGQQFSQSPEYSIFDSQGLGQLLVGETTDRCQPQSNKNQRRTRRRRRRRRRQLCPAPLLKPTGQDTRQESGQDTGQNSGIWPTEFWPDDLPTAKIPPRPSVKADLEKCHHEKYNTPVCHEGVDSSPNLASTTSEWTLPNCIPLMPWHKECAGAEDMWCCQVVEVHPPLPSASDDLNLIHKHSCYRCIRQALLPKKPSLPPPLGESNVHDGNF